MKQACPTQDLYAMRLEPREAALPSLLRIGLYIAGPVIRMESMSGILEKDKLRLTFASGQCLLHFCHSRHRNPSILAAIQTQHRNLEISSNIDRVMRLQSGFVTDQSTVPGDTCADLRIMCCI